MTVVWIALAGAVGAPLRYVVDAHVNETIQSRFPWGTFAVNVMGSLAFGLLVGLQHDGHLAPRAVTIAGTGLCGAFTTFSTHAVESVLLVEDGERRLAAYNIVSTLLTCLCAAAVGFGLAALG
ncbi:MAG: fluoride efflux transporter CrcB [Actinomycetes bacterium]